MNETLRRRCTRVMRRIWDDRQWHMDKQWHIQYRLAHSCPHLAYVGCNYSSNSSKQVSFGQIQLFLSSFHLLPFKKCCSTECTLLLSPFPFVCGLQCSTHQLYVTRRKNLSKPNHIITATHSLHSCHHISSNVIVNIANRTVYVNLIQSCSNITVYSQ